MTTSNGEGFSLPEQSRVIIVHGAIRRAVTKVWMESLCSYLSARGIPAECFYWSGIPASFATRAGCIKLLTRLRQLQHQPVAIWCKSTGADVVNLAAAHIKPNVIVQVAPGFAGSTVLVPTARRVTIRLAHDSFLDFWERMRIVHRISTDQDPEHIIVGPPDLRHHDLNYDRDVVLSTQRRIHLYALYAEALAAGLIATA
jgi:hypothetical protein